MNLKALKDIPPWDWPPTAGKTLLDALRSPRSSEPDLLLAAELAGDFTVINDDLSEALLALVADASRNEQLRGTAAIALGPILEHADTEGFGDPDEVPIAEQTFHKIQKRLRELFDQQELPSEVRRRVLEASVRAPQQWHHDAVRTAYESTDEAWRLTAVFCMQHVRGFEQQIVEALGDRNPAIRYEALIAAGAWPVEQAWPYVRELLTSKDTEKHLLIAAIEAVGFIRPLEAGSLLARFADSDDDDILAAVDEALAIAEGSDDDEFDEDDDDDDEDDEDDESPLNDKTLN